MPELHLPWLELSVLLPLIGCDLCLPDARPGQGDELSALPPVF